MRKKINLPFINNQGGTKKSFKILSDKEMNKNAAKNKTIIGFIKKLLTLNKKNTKNTKNTNKKIM